MTLQRQVNLNVLKYTYFLGTPSTFINNSGMNKEESKKKRLLDTFKKVTIIKNLKR